jgi:hypothetical protein
MRKSREILRQVCLARTEEELLMLEELLECWLSWELSHGDPGPETLEEVYLRVGWDEDHTWSHANLLETWSPEDVELGVLAPSTIDPLTTPY